jgi:hypothetical protein
MTAHFSLPALPADTRRGGLRRRIAIAAVAATAALGAAFATSDQTALAATAATGQNCVTDLSTGGERCFGSFRDALGYATDGRVTDASANPKAALADKGVVAQLNARSAVAGARASYVIGVIYDGAGMTWSSHTFVTNRGCTDTYNDVDWELAYVGDSWNDDIGSVRGYSNCAMKLYEHANFGGVATPWYTWAPHLGALQEEASSIRWT